MSPYISFHQIGDGDNHRKTNSSNKSFWVITEVSAIDITPT